MGPIPSGERERARERERASERERERERESERERASESEWERARVSERARARERERARERSSWHHLIHYISHHVHPIFPRYKSWYVESWKYEMDPTPSQI